MVAPKNNAFAGRRRFIGKISYKRDEVGWRHASVSAKLIDLIGRRFDHDFSVKRFCQQKGCAQNVWMRRADRGDRNGCSCAIALHNIT